MSAGKAVGWADEPQVCPEPLSEGQDYISLSPQSVFTHKELFFFFFLTQMEIHCG